MFVLGTHTTKIVYPPPRNPCQSSFDILFEVSLKRFSQRCKSKNFRAAALVTKKVQLFSKKCLTSTALAGIIAHVERLTPQDAKQNIGDLHSGSAVDSDSTCGSSILSSPTRTKPSDEQSGGFSVLFSADFTQRTHRTVPKVFGQIKHPHRIPFSWEMQCGCFFRLSASGLNHLTGC